MKTHGEWVRQSLARRGKTQTELADLLGKDKSAISRMISGERDITSGELYRIANLLGTPPPGFSEEAAPYAPYPSDARAQTAPIFAVTIAASGRWLLLRGEGPIDARPRAPHFENATKVYGFYAPDDDAAPRFKSGEIVWIDPVRPLKPGDDAALAERTDGPAQLALGEFRRATQREIVIVAYRDQKESRFSAAHWSALHVLPRY